jgi:hypothetical protein
MTSPHKKRSVWALVSLEAPRVYGIDTASGDADKQRDVDQRIRVMRLVEAQWLIFGLVFAADRMAIDVWDFTDGFMGLWWVFQAFAQLETQVLLSNNAAHESAIGRYTKARLLYILCMIFSLVGMVAVIQEFVSCGALESGSLSAIRECYDAATADNIVSASTFICTDGSGTQAGVSKICPLVQFGTAGGYMWYIFLAFVCVVELSLAAASFAYILPIEEYIIEHILSPSPPLAAPVDSSAQKTATAGRAQAFVMQPYNHNKTK